MLKQIEQMLEPKVQSQEREGGRGLCGLEQSGGNNLQDANTWYLNPGSGRFLKPLLSGTKSGQRPSREGLM